MHLRTCKWTCTCNSHACWKLNSGILHHQLTPSHKLLLKLLHLMHAWCSIMCSIHIFIRWLDACPVGPLLRLSASDNRSSLWYMNPDLSPMDYSCLQTAMFWCGPDWPKFYHSCNMDVSTSITNVLRQVSYLTTASCLLLWMHYYVK